MAEATKNASSKTSSESGLLVYAPDSVGNKEEFITLVKKDLIHGKGKDPVTETELVYFLQVCQSSGLNPITKQIYAIFRGGKMTIQAGIDGLRAIAERSGRYGGSTEGKFEYDDEDKLVRASVTVFKDVNGKTYETTGTAKFSEYVVDTSPMWRKMPETMLEKCAEAKALRKAFPNIGQIYVEEEMAQADKLNIKSEDIVKPDAKKIESEVTALVDQALDEREDKTDADKDTVQDQ